MAIPFTQHAANKESREKQSAGTLKPLDDLIDKQIVLQTLHISDRTLQNWRSTGKIPFYKVGGKIFYKQSELAQMLEASRTHLLPVKK